MSDRSGLAERMLRLVGVVVLEVEARPGETVVTVETDRRVGVQLLMSFPVRADVSIDDGSIHQLISG